MFRRKKRCQNLCPSLHSAYHGRQCEGTQDHDGLCYIKTGGYRHLWRQEWYERLGQAIKKEDG